MHEPIEFERAQLIAALATAGKVRPWQREYMREVRRQNSAGDIETMKVRDTKPGLIRIEVRDGHAFITSGNLEMSITVAIPAFGEATMYLPLVNFGAAVEKAPAGAMITLQPNGADTTFRTGRFRSTMSGIVEDFAPVRPALDGEPAILPASLIKEGLAATSPATLDDAKRPFLGGVYLHDGPEGLSLVAMDGARLHSSSTNEARLHSSVILPEKTADLLAVVLPDEGDVQILVGPRHVEIHSYRMVIASPVIDSQFPAYGDKLKVAANGVLTGRADQLLADLDLAATVADPKTRDVRLDLSDRSTVSAFRRAGNGVEMGAVELLAKYAGPPMAIGFQMKLVQDALHTFGNAEVEWRLQGPMEPSVIVSPARPSFQAMVSPIRLLGEHMRIAA